MVGIVALALVAIAVVALSARALVRRRGWSRPRLSPGPRLRLPAGRLRLATAGTVLLVVLGITLVILARSNSAGTSQADALATNPDLDPGTPVSGVAPDFSLADQFGQPVSLHSFRGKVVILAFNDSECTTVCPLTTTAMLDAKAMLGKAGSQVQLLGVDADPGRDLARGRVVLLGVARDAPLVAVPHRLAAAAEAGLEAVRDRGGGRGRGDHPHAGAVRDRSGRAGCLGCT